MKKVITFFNKKVQNEKSPQVPCEVAQTISTAMGLTTEVMNNAKSLLKELEQLEKIRIKKCSL